jgi:dihydroneopterin aldolase
MQPKIIIEELSIQTLIGVLPAEKIQPQTVLITLEFDTVIPSQDQITAVVDYAQVATTITDFVSRSKFELLETLAQQVADLVQRQFSLSNLRLQITKPAAITNARGVKIILMRD